MIDDLQERTARDENDPMRTTLKLFDEDDLENEDDNGVFVGISSVLGSRSSQQDTVFGQFSDGVGIGVVCDGMGGLNGGERASATAVEALATAYYDSMPIEDYGMFFRKQAARIDSLVADLKDENGNNLGAGTTMVAATIHENKMYFLSVGDSRIYLIRGNSITALNRLHNYRMTMDQKLSEGTMSPEEYKSQQKQAEALISFMGMGNISIIDTNPDGLELMHRDMILLCSDGLYKILKAEEILSILCTHSFDMQKAAQMLTSEATARCKRKQDNTSVVLMQYKHSIL